jgi:hypothetical protein
MKVELELCGIRNPLLLANDHYETSTFPVAFNRAFTLPDHLAIMG